jgi:pimeloyl-ACP methyl ester carboxylesterase
MTKVLVHGNPETDAIWGQLVAALAERGVDDIVTVSPPGFGVPSHPDWNPTPAAYVDWLHGEIIEFDGDVDLLGHDWGASHVLGVAAAYPESIRSWAVDVAGLVHPDYRWHDAAAGWQTPEVGEQIIDAMVSMLVAERIAAYQGLGLPTDVAVSMAEALGPDMGRCILGLYRAAVQPFMAQLGDRLAAAESRPSLIIDATADEYVSTDLVAAVADRNGSTVHPLADQGHWWMLSAPDLAADGLTAFWKGLETPG